MEFKTHATLHKDGTYSIGVNLDYGFMSPDDLISIAELARKYNVTEIKATTAKKISFYNVPEENVNPLWDEIVATFGDRVRNPKGKIIVCPGQGHCKFAMPGFEGHSLADEIVNISQAHNAGKIKVGVATCPRCCSMAQVRDIAVYASAKGWTVAVGGNGGSKPASGTTLATGLSDEEAIALVDKIYTYIEKKKNGSERTNRLLARLGVDDLKAYLGLE